MFKQILVFARKSMKLTILIAVSIFIIICAVALFFKPIYSVTINGEAVGYSKDKSKLQSRINKYMEAGDGEEGNHIAFVQINNLPEYKMCLLKRNIVTNDDEIFEKIKQSGVIYYKYYAVLDGELKEFAEVDATVASLYQEKVVVQEPIKPVKQIVTGKVNTSTNISYQKVGLSLNLIRPISGTITSRFGAKSSIRSSNHTGLDIGATIGTPVKAAARGTVTFAGYKGSYGYLVVVSHGNGVETYYGHCSKLYVSAGQTVSQGDVISAVGNTGNSTGPHLHLEIRVNGVAYNPENYLY